MTSLAFILAEVPAPPLNGVYNKLRMELSLYDLITGLYNGISNLLVQYMGRHIGISRGLFILTRFL